MVPRRARTLTPLVERRTTKPMSAKQLHFGDKARNDILHGIDQLANAIKITLGPCGRNVILDK